MALHSLRQLPTFSKLSSLKSVVVQTLLTGHQRKIHALQWSSNLPLPTTSESPTDNGPRPRAWGRSLFTKKHPPDTYKAGVFKSQEELLSRLFVVKVHIHGLLNSSLLGFAHFEEVVDLKAEALGNHVSWEDLQLDIKVAHVTVVKAA